MLNRWIGISAAFLMILANGAIIWRDMLPTWLAGDPPPSEAAMLAPGAERRVQVGIYEVGGRLMGRSWTLSRCTSVGGIVAVRTTTVLNPIDLPGGVLTPAVRIETMITYRPAAATYVDELEFKMYGLGVPISLHAEAMPTGEFPLQWQVGSQRGSIALDSRAPAALGDVIRPFDRLPELYVGRTWRLQLLDPLAQLLPNLPTTGLGLEPVLIRVTRRETITHRREDGPYEVEAFVVEGGDARAWVAPDGTVLRQEVNLPLVGRLVLLEEPYDDAALSKARRVGLGGPGDNPIDDAPQP